MAMLMAVSILILIVLLVIAFIICALKLSSEQSRIEEELKREEDENVQR